MGQSLDQAIQKELNYQPTRQDYINAMNCQHSSKDFDEAAKAYNAISLVGLCTGNPALISYGMAGSINNAQRSKILKDVGK